MEIKIIPNIENREGVDFYVGSKGAVAIKEMDKNHLKNAIAKAERLATSPFSSGEAVAEYRKVVEVLQAELSIRPNEDIQS